MRTRKGGMPMQTRQVLALKMWPASKSSLSVSRTGRRPQRTIKSVAETRLDARAKLKQLKDERDDG